MKVYLYLDISEYSVIERVTDHNYWSAGTDPSNPNLYVGQYATMLLVETKEIPFHIKAYDPITFRILSLESKLTKDIADSHVRQNKIKDKIQELKCIGHDVEEEEIPPHPNAPVIDTFDDDIGF